MSIKINQDSSKKPFPTRMVISLFALFVIPISGYFIWDATFGGVQTAAQQQFTEAGASKSGTAFTGEDVGSIDPEIAQAFCEDNLKRFDVEDKSRIIDSCLSDTVTREWLSNLSNQELEGLINSEPTCFTTGIDSQGYNCITGFNDEGCNRDNLREDGSMCVIEGEGNGNNLPGSNVDINALFSGDERVCSVLEACETESEFNPEGFNKFNCDRAGKRPDGSACPYTQVTKIYTDGKDQFGFGRDGFNDRQCDARGNDRSGRKCAYDDITKLYSDSGKDQFGFNPDQFNGNGCSIKGLDRSGNACLLEDITRIFDPETGRDQFGFGRDNFNEKNCDINGFNRVGELCAPADITRVVGKNGLDHRGLFANNMNAVGCGVDGKRRDGTMCDIKDIPNIQSVATGLSPLGLFESNFNEKGCSVTGYDSRGKFCPIEDIPRLFDPVTGLDQFKLDKQGYNSANCNVFGYDKLGNLCDFDDIPRIIDPETGRDQFNLDSRGFSPAGCGFDGRKEDGSLCDPKDIVRLINPVTGKDQFQLDAQGYNEAGCSLQGTRKDGSVCDIADIPRIFDENTGRDQFGFDAKNRNAKGCGFDGRRADGSICEFADITRIVGKSGVDQNGLLGNALSPNGCSIDGLDENGVPCETVSQEPVDNTDAIIPSGNALANLGFVNGEYNANGCDVMGFRANGSRCEFEDITRVFDPLTNRDQFGFNPQGYNIHNCSAEGLTPTGQKCREDLIPRIYDKKGVDQFGISYADSPIAKQLASISSIASQVSPALKEKLGLDNSGYSIETGCNIQGLRRDGSLCELKDIPRIFDPETGRDQFGLTSSGYNSFGCDLSGKRANGEACDASQITEILDAQGRNQFGERVIGLPKNNPLYTREGIVSLNQKLREPNGGKRTSLVGVLDEKGFSIKTGCNVKGLREDGTLCDYDDIPKIYDPITGRDQFNIGRDGLNEFNCSIDGKKPDGSTCSKDEITELVDAFGNNQFGERVTGNPRNNPLFTRPGAYERYAKTIKNSGIEYEGNLINPNALSTLDDASIALLGLDESLRNAKGCSIDGTDEQGNVCDINDIPRVFDPVTGRDQFGLDRDNRNINGCGFYGYREDGSRCNVSEMTLIKGADGQNQFTSPKAKPRTLSNTALRNLASLEGNDNIANPKVLTPSAIAALGLDENNRNAKGCGLDGRRADGSLCALEDTPRVFDPETGLDQFGLTRDNRNTFGCGLDGKRSDGSICSLDETTVLVDAQQRDSKGQRVDARRLNVNKVPDEDKGVLAKIASSGLPSSANSIAALTEKQIDSALSGISKGLANGSVLDSLTRKQLNDLNLDANFRNDKGCGLDGLDASGRVCALEDIPRVFDPVTGIDQFGFTQDNRNIHGCDFNGIGRNGQPCDESKKTRIFGDDGFDQSGFNRANYNRLGLNKDLRNIYDCDLSGFKSDGTACSEDEKIQLPGMNISASDYLTAGSQDAIQLINGVNEKGCSLQGFKANGERCSLEDTPRLFTANGTDQFGLRRNNRNEAGCDLMGRDMNGDLCPLEDITRIYNLETGLDQFGFTRAGYNQNNCDAMGRKPNGARCELNEITRITAADGSDQFGVFADSFNEAGCSWDGLNRDGEVCALEDIPMIIGADGMSQLGITRTGFAANNCSISGVDRQGNRCAIDDIPKLYNDKGQDQFGLDKQLRNAKGCSITGFRENGTRCDAEDIPRIVINEKDQFGFDVAGVNQVTGCDINNKDEFGQPCHPAFAIKIVDNKGVDQFGMKGGFNEFSCDLNGRKPDGSLCELKEITRVFNEETGRDQFDLTPAGLTTDGCGLDGKRADGTLCKPNDIPRLTDANGVDQLGLDDKGYSAETQCNLLGRKPDGSLCNKETTPFVLGNDGLTHLNVNATGVDRDGRDAFGFFEDGCNIDNVRIDGTKCERTRDDLKLTKNDSDRIEYFRKSQLELMASYMEPSSNGIGAGTVTVSEPVYQSPTQGVGTFIGAQPTSIIANAPNGVPGTETATNGNGMIEIPLGTAMNVYVETTVNTDYTETVWGTIIGGELDGVRVKGRVDVPYINDPVMPRDKVRYTFDAMVFNRRSYPINAVSMSVDDFNEFLEGDNVDYHRVQRFGGLLGAIALQALGATYLDSNEERALERQAELTEQSSAVLLGQNTNNIARETTRTVTDEVANLARQQYNRRPTVEKEPDSVMIVFMEEVDDDNLPIVFSDIRY